MSFLDSLRAAFKGGGGAAMPLARGLHSPWSWTYEQGGARPAFDYRSAVRHAFLDNPVAQRAVRIVAEGVGDAPLAEADPAVLALIRSSHGGQSLLEVLAANLLLHGNAYVQVARGSGSQPVSLFALRPERVSVVQGTDGWPTGYRYRVGDQVREIPLEDADGWPCLIHLKSFHPADDHYGARGHCRADRCAGSSGDTASELTKTFPPVRSVYKRAKGNAMTLHKTAIAALALLSASACTTTSGDGDQVGAATLIDTSGSTVGTARLFSQAGEVSISVTLEGLPAGAHGVHLHTTGNCSTSDFTSAGGHLNPGGAQHGSHNPQGAHLGDLPNVQIAANGSGSISASLRGNDARGLANIFDADGTAIVVHAGPDDYLTDPSGNSGSRIACGVFARS